MSIEQAEFRFILGHFASSVTVITTQYQKHFYGATISSFCSLSLQPPLILACMDRRAAMHDLTRTTEVFGINILAEHAEHLSRHFACHILDKFSSVPYTLGELGVPLLDDAVATLECRLTTCYPGGDHSIFIGEVMHMKLQAHRHPLLYFRGQYGQLASNLPHLVKQRRSMDQQMVREKITV